MKTQFLTLTLIVFCASAQAQTKDSISRNWRIVEASVSFGTTNRLDQELSKNDFQRYHPTSTIIENIPANFNNENPFLHGFQMLPSSTLALNLGVKKKGKPAMFRLGVLYQGMGPFGTFYSHSESTGAYDTLTSSATGQTFYLDSTRHETYMIDIRNENLGLDVAVTYSTNYKRLNFFAGIGLNALFSINSRTFIGHTIERTYGQENSMISLQIEGEVFKNKSAFSTSIYIPIGIDFTLGKKRPLLAKTSLHAEFRPALYMQQMPDSKFRSSVSRTALFGLKYSI